MIKVAIQQKFIIGRFRDKMREHLANGGSPARG